MSQGKKVAVVAHGYGAMRGYSGEGKVYLEGISALKERGVDYVIVSFSKPKEGKSAYFLPFRIRRFDKYQRLLVWFPARKLRPSLYLNLSGVPIPLSKIAPHVIYAGGPAIASAPTKYSRSLFWKLYLLPFKSIAKRLAEEARKAYIIANSWYSANLIKEAYGAEAKKVIYPPVDVEFYRNAFSESKEPFFLSIGRIERGKSLENAVRLSAISGVKGVIVGSLGDKGYLNYLRGLSGKLRAPVEFLVNLPREELLEVMKRASVYFHPTVGEHFGIPIVEAMSAGLIPIVPKESGGQEVVPEFSYTTLEEASSLLKQLLNADAGLRREMSKRAEDFSSAKFKSRLYDEISKFL
ncbi:MAG: group 1 glycosyl transferase [Candidatus Aramenus sulfurataquae]|uniref:Glycosyltransferase family 4 protein n=3 Tax=Candidatus Aramenus sulfurataquae TaxID=1326980 RepID=W7L8N5_9CREN|nr:MAG: group 1 glycosyl transferase [Candidatus Aramenus sulfurataquae]MCL7343038.1 glycosyltransferase family 4 protein [Candidatus Aramenus sulfurataquae]